MARRGARRVPARTEAATRWCRSRHRDGSAHGPWGGSCTPAHRQKLPSSEAANWQQPLRSASGQQAHRHRESRRRPAAAGPGCRGRLRVDLRRRRRAGRRTRWLARLGQAPSRRRRAQRPGAAALSHEL